MPAISQVDALTDAREDLHGSSKALTYYCVKPMTVVSTGKVVIISPAIDHYSKVSGSTEKLQFARADQIGRAHV